MAHEISNISRELLVVSASMGLNPAIGGDHGKPNDKTINWFNERFDKEKLIFIKNTFKLKNGGVLNKPQEINSDYVYDLIKEFNPDVIVVFGTGIIKGKLLCIPKK